MKITIAFLPEDYEQMRIIRTFLTHYLPGSRLRNNFKGTPYMHCYLTTPKKVQNAPLVKSEIDCPP